MSDLADRLANCYASAVHDVLREMGHDNCVLSTNIMPLRDDHKVAGEVYTISGHIDQTLSRHESLLLWSRVLSQVPGGKVLICQPNTKAIALMGELSAQALMAKGTRGYVVDGHCRDVDLTLDTGLPVFCESATPADICERWKYDALGDPITIGTVTIRTGDYVVGDRDGVVIVPAEAVEEAVTKTEHVMATESDMRQAIIDGMDPEKAYLKFGMF
jgi:4-hydroxy-4-methyl-2-oxoglutarate aldolase